MQKREWGMGNGERNWRRLANDAGDGEHRNRGQDATARAAMNLRPRVLRTWSPIPQRRRPLRVMTDTRRKDVGGAEPRSSRPPTMPTHIFPLPAFHLTPNTNQK